MLRIVKPYFYCIAFFVCILLSTHAIAQPQSRGFGDLAPAKAVASGRTVALVVGVSDYPYVAPLNYAAEDALLMYDFLQSKAGGSVPKENIRLLINEEATSQNVWTRGLSWIKNSFMPRPSDHIIIYLAGHGDADEYNSYFLCHNANPAGDKNNYNWTDVLNIETLKKYIAGFSASGAEVILIMDACRSGDIPGARAGITNPFESVVERRAGETLMLSASANQLAVEDRRWGRGHGVFTWNLIQGLSGKADENGDGSIDFYEIEQYTKAKVRKETQAMGRMQVPQFAAAPSGGGALGRVDNAFLNKLSTEALSSVSVSESIAQARTAAESSWFTDSTLYAGFNELKKLVRDGKYLGKGSAEPIYTRLAEQFSADQIEPVRLYYMSALASAGFEAINQKLLSELGMAPSATFYSKRYRYLLKAKNLQLNPHEITQLEDFLKLTEAMSISSSALDRGELPNLSVGMVDSLSAMRERFEKNAAYYYWMAEFGIEPIMSKKYDMSSYQFTELFFSNVDSCIKYAPNWPRVRLLQITSMPVEELTDSVESGILKLISDEPTNSEFRALLYGYYSRRRPFNSVKWAQSLMNWCVVDQNISNIRRLLSLINSLNDSARNEELDTWLNASALKNHFKFSIPSNYLMDHRDWFNSVLSTEVSEDYIDYCSSEVIKYLIDVTASTGQLFAFSEVFYNSSKAKSSYISTMDLSIISAVLGANGSPAGHLQYLDSLLMERVQSEKIFYTDSNARMIAYRILMIRGIEELNQFREQQIKILRELKYNGSQEDFLLFMANEYTTNSGINVPDDFADSLLALCQRNPTEVNCESYINLIEVHKLKNRQIQLYNDVKVRCFLDSIQGNESVEMLRFRVEIMHHLSTMDTLRIKKILLESSTDSYKSCFIAALLQIEPELRKELGLKMLKENAIKLSFNELVDLGLLELAESAYSDHFSNGREYGGWEPDIEIDVQRELHAMKLFIQLGNFEKASDILLELLRINASLLEPYSCDGIFQSQLGPYDAFIQSKEYKAMMARVYTAPEK